MGWIPAVTGGASVAAAAAAQQQEEEEDMTRYTPEELAEGWEFKIVRSASSAFRNPATFQRVIEEEALSGWELVEKFDDSRIRFKRPHSARERDQFLDSDIDPYRTNLGSSQAFLIGLIVAGLVILLVLGIVVFFVDGVVGTGNWGKGHSNAVPLVFIPEPTLLRSARSQPCNMDSALIHVW